MPRKSPTKAKPKRHEAPIVALAFCGGSLFSASTDGRVLRLSDDLVPEAVIRDAPRDPATALASAGERLVVASAKALLVVDRDGEVVAKAPLVAATAALAVRGASIFVLGGGAVRRYEIGPKALRKGAVCKHAKGVATQLDVDDAGAQALVVLDGHRVELLDLAKRKSLAQWSRGETAISVRFTKSAPAAIAVDEDSYGLRRIKASTGRSSGELSALDSSANGPIVLDGPRSVAAVRSCGEDVEVVALDRAATYFFFAGAATPASEKLLASIRRIPRLVELAPGFVVRKGSTPAPPPPRTQTALALDDGGARVAAGYVSGEILAADTNTARVASSHRGVVAQARCRALRFAALSEHVAVGQSDREVWHVGRDGEVLVADLEQLELVSRGKLELPEVGPGYARTLHLGDEHITFVCPTHVARWPRSDLSRRVIHALPEHKGAVLHRGEVVLVPKASVGHGGFDLVTIDPATGESRPRARFERDGERFPHGNDPDRWVAIGHAGDQPTIMIWAGKGLTVAQTFAFDVDAATIGIPLPWGICGHGRSGARMDPDARRMIAFDLASGETLATAPLDEDDGGGLPAAFDPASRVIAAALGNKIALWRGDAPRLELLGHRDPKSLWLGAGGRGLLVRDRFTLRLWDITPS